MNDEKKTVRKLSTGEDSTLKTWINLATALYGEDSKPVTFLKDKAASAPHGEDEEVIADEGQLILLLSQMYSADLTKEVRSSINHFGVWCREFRIERDEILRDMAHKLDLNVSRLNAMENNRYPIDHDIAERIEKVYALDEKQLDALKVALNLSPNYKIRNEEDIHENSDDKRTNVHAEEYRLRQLRTYGIWRADDQGRNES